MEAKVVSISPLAGGVHERFSRRLVWIWKGCIFSDALTPLFMIKSKPPMVNNPRRRNWSVWKKLKTFSKALMNIFHIVIFNLMWNQFYLKFESLLQLLWEKAMNVQDLVSHFYLPFPSRWPQPTTDVGFFTKFFKAFKFFSQSTKASATNRVRTKIMPFESKPFSFP